jgi:hypothetical protein
VIQYQRLVLPANATSSTSLATFRMILKLLNFLAAHDFTASAVKMMNYRCAAFIYDSLSVWRQIHFAAVQVKSELRLQ